MPCRRVPLVLTLILASSAAADTVIKTGGQKLEGEVIAETENEVTLQTSVGELLVRTKIARAEIVSIQKDAAAQNRYCRIPIHGEIGVDVKAQWLDKALQQARGFKPRFIVFDIDSPGGSVAEMAKIMEVISQQEGVHTIAHVRRAMSASAMIAICCRTIVMDPRGSIGAAVPWRIGPEGTPRDVEAKFIASYRALCRSAAEVHRHEPLLAQGMMDLDLVLSIVPGSDGRPKVVEGRGTGSVAAVPLKKQGEILCLSAREALACGFAAGIAEDVRELQRLVGAKDWSAVGEPVWAYLQARPAAARAEQERDRESLLASQRKERIAQMLSQVDTRIAELKKAKEQAANRVAAIPIEYQAELSRIDPRLTGPQQDAKNKEIRKRHETAYAEAQNALRQADAELQELLRLKAETASNLREQ